MSKPPNPVTLCLEAVGVQQSVAATFKFTGVRPLEDGAAAAATWDKDRNTVIIASPADATPDPIDGGGLFFPDDVFSQIAGNVFCTHFQIMSSAAVTWTLYLTSGFGDGDATTKDDPVHDIALANGTAAANVKVMQELLPQQALRLVVTGSPTAAIYAVANFTATTGDYGRIIA